MFVEVSNIKKSYGEGGSYVQVLKGVSVGVDKGEMCVIQGTSGSGKSTLLNCIGGLDEVDSGYDTKCVLWTECRNTDHLLCGGIYCNPCPLLCD